MFVDLYLHRTVDGVIVGGVRDVRRHMDGVSHLKAWRARLYSSEMKHVPVK